MSKPLLFYVIDERTDDVKYCKRKGLKPHKFKELRSGIVGDPIFKTAVQYVKGGYLYDVLEGDQCYSGYMVTLMRLPKLSYEKLLDTALTSTKFEERAGAIGIILKEHPIEFVQYLSSIKNMSLVDLSKEHGIKRIVTTINGFIRKNTSYVRSLEKVLSLCEEIELRIEIE